MVFFKKIEAQIKEVSEFDGEQAHKLYNYLKTNRLLAKTYKSPSVKQWANEFRKMRSYLSIEEIAKVLEWYTHHSKEEFVPKAYSAKKFRSEFDRISRAMEKAGISVKEVAITPRARKIQKGLNLTWPGTEGAQELQFIQLNLNYLESFFIRLKILREQLKPDTSKKTYKISSHYRIVNNLFESLLGPFEIIYNYTLRVNELSYRYEDYSGNLISKVLNDNNTYWNKLLARYIAEYHGDGLPWLTIKDMLSKIKEK